MNPFVEIINKSELSDISSLIDGASDGDLHNSFKTKNSDFFRKIFHAGSQDNIRKIAESVDPIDFVNALLSIPVKQIAPIIEILDKKHLSRIFHNFSDESFGEFLDYANSKNSRLKLIDALPNNQKNKWLKHVVEHETYLKQIKRNTDAIQQSFIDQKNTLLSDLEEAIAGQERKLHELKNREINLLQEEQAKRDAIINQSKQIINENALKEEELKKKEANLAEREAEFEKESKLLVQQRIEAKVPEFVQSALKVLETRETAYKKKAFQWSVHGTIVLLVCIFSIAGISLYGYAYGEDLSSLGWETLIFISLKGVVLISILGLWAKHAFSVSNAYMHEAIKRADRAHAINFGKLYLEIYGNTVDRKELINIFENWNITSESAFAKYAPDSFEPKILDKFIDFAKSSTRKSED